MAGQPLASGLQGEELLACYQHAQYGFAGRFVRGNTVLDVSCGTGEGSMLLSQAGAQRVVGLGFSGPAIEQARDRYHAPNLDYRLKDEFNVRHYPEFDLIVSLGTLEHLGQPEYFVYELAQALSPLGMLIISTPNRTMVPLGGRRPGWDEEGFRKLLGYYFEDVRLLGQDFAFPRRWLPGVQAGERLLARLLYPGLLELLGDVAVRELPQVPPLRVVPSWLVALCLDPRPLGGGPGH